MIPLNVLAIASQILSIVTGIVASGIIRRSTRVVGQLVQVLRAALSAYGYIIIRTVAISGLLYRQP